MSRPPTITAAAFAVLAERTGLKLTPQQLHEMYLAYGDLEYLVERVGVAREREAEPMPVVRLDAG